MWDWGQPVFDAGGVSGNGAIVVGQLSDTTAFRWTAAGGLVTLPALPGGTYNVYPTDITPDGSVIVGWSDSTNGN